MEYFPREVIYQIYKRLDIDSRRALNIYTKLKTPECLIKKISNTFIHTNMPDDAKSLDAALVVFQLPYYDEDIKEFYANMMHNDKEEMPLGSKKRHVMTVLLSWFEKFEFTNPGVMIRAGIPDGQDEMIIDFRALKENEENFIMYGVNQTSFDHL